MRFIYVGVFILLITQLWVNTASARLDLGVSSASYLGQGPESRQKNYTSLTLGVDQITDGDLIVSRAWIQGLLSFNDADYRFVEAPELYVGNHAQAWSWYGGRDSVQVTVGRKLEQWSQLDSHWGLGAWQPRFRWDYLQPQQAGLVGLQTAVKTGIVTTTLFYSPIFVPDRGAPIDFADGRIRSISPWALNPPALATYRGKDTEIRYDADIPHVSDIIRHHAISGKVAIGKETGAWASVAAAYKPMNQLPMAFDPIFQLPNSSAPPYIDVKIYPRVTYHSVYSLDAGWKNRFFDVWGSFLADVPKDPIVIIPERVSQNVSRMALVSPTITYYPYGRGPDSGLMSLSYLKRFGEDLPDTGVDSTGASAGDGTTAFDSNYVYSEAILVGLRTPSWRNVTGDARLLYDVAHPGTILSWNVTYRPQAHWALYVAADVLTSLSNEAPVLGNDFIFRYRANDRVMGGVTYAF